MIQVADQNNFLAPRELADGTASVIRVTLPAPKLFTVMSDVKPRSANEVFATQLQDEEIQLVYKEIEQHAIDFAVKADILGQAETGAT